MKYVIEARWEWAKEITVEADNYIEAEIAAVQRAKDDLAEQFEDGTPSMDEFDLTDLTP